jgi:hypothetical protein
MYKTKLLIMSYHKLFVLLFFPMLCAGCGFTTATDSTVKFPTEPFAKDHLYIQKISYIGAANRTTNAKFVDVSGSEKTDNAPYDQVTYSYLNNENYFSSISSKKNLKSKINKDRYFHDRVFLNHLYENHFPNQNLRRDRKSDYTFPFPDCP